MPGFRRERLVVGLLIVAVAAVWFGVYSALDRTLEVTFLDVGEGDSILVHAPSGLNVLIDGGGRPGEVKGGWDVGRQVVVPALLVAGVRRLDAVIATHFDADHIGGLPAVLDEVPAGMLLCGGVPFASGRRDRLLASAGENGVRVKGALLGQVFHFGPGIRALVLHPGPVPMTGTGSDSNNNSAVLRLVYGDVSFLFTADIEAPAQRAVISRGLTLHSTVLKVPHHGSADAALPAFDRAVHPALAVVSVGVGNSYGHPSRAALSALMATGARILRTDLSGAIMVRSDGHAWRALTYREGRWRPAVSPGRH